MIVRILGESQFSVPDSERHSLEALDKQVAAAVDRGDETTFAGALHDLVEAVRAAGTRIPDDRFEPSDLVVPFSDATLAETKKLLAEADGSSGDGAG